MPQGLNIYMLLIKFEISAWCNWFRVIIYDKSVPGYCADSCLLSGFVRVLFFVGHSTLCGDETLLFCTLVWTNAESCVAVVCLAAGRQMQISSICFTMAFSFYILHTQENKARSSNRFVRKVFFNWRTWLQSNVSLVDCLSCFIFAIVALFKA